MSTSVCLVISVVWLVAGIINIVHHASWGSVAFDFVLFAVFAVVGVVRAIRSGEDGRPPKKKK
jgi:hypothetical protein